MIRKAMAGLGLLALGSYMWMGTSVGSYARTGAHQAHDYFKGQVSVDFELKRARQMCRELVPNIHKTMRTIAEEKVKTARLRDEIATTEKNLSDEKLVIQSLKDKLSEGKDSYKLGSLTYSKSELDRDLNRRFRKYQKADSTLAARHEILKSRDAALRAARDQYEGLIEAKQELEAELAGLEARNKMLLAQATANKFHVDDSKLAEVRSLINDIGDRLDVDELVVEQEGNLISRIPVEEIPSGNLANEIDNYFSEVDQPETESAL